MQGIKHLIQCHCILNQFKHIDNAPLHHFVVFSEIDDNNDIIIKFALCNNCGVVHKVEGICKSKVLLGKENLATITKIKDIEIFLDKNLCNILKAYNCEISTWEYIQFVINNEKWGEKIILTKEKIDGQITGKVLIVDNQNKFKVETYIREEFIT